MMFGRFKICVMLFVISLLLVPNISAQSNYKKTPQDAEGPFYPTERQADEDNDLIHIKGTTQSAKGDVLHLTGAVFNQAGTPQSDVVVEIWQTDANGIYRHPRDRSAGARDPFFQYWGRATTDNEGKYNFKTLIPGAYEPRPAHIHFKVWEGDKVVLTSQMYIVKDAVNSAKVNELLRLDVTKNKEGEYSGFFRIVY